jgi:hypothetical protein
MQSALREWETFYVIVGSAAAALTGLQFVVIALISEARNVGGGQAEMETFATPTVVHFCTVLLISAIASVPHQSATSLRICIVVPALILLVYIAWVTGQARRVTGYQPVLEDWIFHVWLPFVCYGALLVAGIGAQTSWSLYVIAASALLLLYIGIHNAWDTAIYISTATKLRREASSTSPGSEDRPQD